MEKATGRRTARRTQKKGGELGPGEKRRLLQLGACLVLFLVVFFAKGADKLETFRGDLARALGADVNVEAVFADLGWSIASGRPVGETLDQLWVDAFVPVEEVQHLGRGGLLYQRARRDLSRGGPAQMLAGGAEEPMTDPMASSASRVQPVQPASQSEPAVVKVDYTGPALPENTSMDRYALGLGETVTPALGVMSSGFGWREHPIEGEERFHYGVDLAVETGTAVGAFAAGTVEYIGESDVYGQYLQLDHGGGVKSFYAHCSRLCVQQGQSVAAGEKVAESGATGEVTGPHLHMELKKDGVRLNPAYYIKTLS